MASEWKRLIGQPDKSGRDHVLLRGLLVFSLILSLPAANAAEMPWGEGYPEYLPDTSSLYKRVRPSPKDEFDGPSDPGPEPLRQITPDYPMGAADKCLNGWVLLEAIVTEDGKTDDIKVVAQDFHGLFDRAAKNAFRRWKFEPATLNGKPIARRVTIPFIFTRARCAGRPAPEPHELSLDSDVELFVDRARGLERADVLVMPVYDDLLGNPEGIYIHAQKWHEGDRIPLDMHRIAADLEMLIAGRDKDTASKAVVKPGSLRFARLNPYAIGREPAGIELEAYFTDKSGRDLVPVYFDRAGSITGVERIGEVMIEYQLDVPGPGIYWVEFKGQEQGNVQVLLAEKVKNPRLVLEDRNQPHPNPADNPRHESSLHGKLQLNVDGPGDLHRGELLLEAIGGLIFGTAEKGLIGKPAWSAGETIELDLEAILPKLRERLHPTPKAWHSRGMNVQPADLHMARVATFARLYDENDARIKVRNTRIGTTDGRRVALVYVDRGGRITGQRDTWQFQYRYQLEFPGAGYYWVETLLDEDGKGADLVNVAALESPILIVR